MRKFSLMLMLAIMTVSSAVFAGSLDYLSNQSARYVMNTASVARTDAADIATYNPAGTAFLAPGLYFDVSNQFLFKYYSAKESNAFSAGGFENDFKQSEPTLLLPNLYVVYNFGAMGPGTLAVFLQAGIVAGGGGLKWDDGTVGSTAFLAGNYGTIISNANAGSPIPGTPLLGPVTANRGSTSLEASSVYYAIGAGASYAVFEDKVSLALGAKYVIAKRAGKINGDINYTFNPTAAGGLGGAAFPIKFSIVDEYEYDAKGVTPVLGFDAKPTKDLTIGLRYEFETKLKFKYKTKDLNATSSIASASAVATGIAAQLPDFDGLKAKQNLPGILSFGAEQVITPELKVALSATIYFMPDSNMEGVEMAFGNGTEMSIGIGYKVMSGLDLGLTCMYTRQGVRKEYLKDSGPILTTSANPILDSVNTGLGATYMVMDGFDITLALNWAHYFPKELGIDGTPFKVKYEKEVYGVSLGVGYKL